MNLTIIKILVFFTTYIFLLGIPSVCSQEDVFGVADEYFLKKNYANAVLEYERVFFNNYDTEIQKYALKKKASCYKLDKKYTSSAKTLQRIPLYNLSLKEKDSIYYEMLLCSYLGDDFDFAEEIAVNMNLEVKENPSKELLLMLILIYNELNDYSSAHNCFLQYSRKTKDLSEEEVKNLDSLYNHIPKNKSTKTAKHLAFLPGLGHIYAGFWAEGICAFIVNAGVLSFGISEFLLKDYITSWIGGAGLLSVTYLGQQKRAVYLTEKYNYLRNKEFNTLIKQILLK